MTKSNRRPTTRPTLVTLEDRTTPTAAFALTGNSLLPFDTAFPTTPLTAVPITRQYTQPMSATTLQSLEQWAVLGGSQVSLPSTLSLPH